MTSESTFAIVGASLAGAKAAETLRTEGSDGRIVLIGTETEHPYERPGLSKDFLRGDIARDALHVHSNDFYTDQDIELWLGRTVQDLDRDAQELLLDDGSRLHYDRLLLATGSASRRLRIPGADLDGVLYLRSVEEAEHLRSRLQRGSTAVVVGAGWIGTEVAASARQRGVDVTVLDPASIPLEHVLGPEVGGVYRDLHADHGVRLLMGTSVAAFEGTGTVERVRTSDDQVLPCGVVAVGVGALPRSGVAERAGLAADDGILVDEHLQTSDRIPYFFSDRYDVGMEYVGYARQCDRVVFRGERASREFIACWMASDRVVAGMNVNTWEVSDAIADLIRARVSVNARDLADPELPLTSLIHHRRENVA